MTVYNYLSQEIYYDFVYIIDPENNHGKEYFKKTV